MSGDVPHLMPNPTALDAGAMHEEYPIIRGGTADVWGLWPNPGGHFSFLQLPAPRSGWEQHRKQVETCQTSGALLATNTPY